MAWLRILGAFAAVVLGILLLRELHPLLVLVIVVSGTWYGVSKLRAEQARDRRTGTELLGLRRSTEDPFGIASYPLQVFARSDEPVVTEVSWGPWQHMNVRVFAAAVRAPNVDGVAPIAGPTTNALAGVFTNLVADVPTVIIEPQVFATLFPRRPTVPRIATGDPAFDDRWTVWTEDPAFAPSILTDDVRAWLLSLGDAWGIELSARIAMIYGRCPEQPDVVAVLEILSGLLRRVPEGLFEPRRPAG